jgi:hypothetical protein
MILNAYTIIVLFIAALTGILALMLAVFSLREYRRFSMAGTGEERTATENRSYLLLLIATVILVVKLLSWPFFYVTLQSYVPHIQGAMCIFGVLQVDAGFSSFLQILKPVMFFLVGGWLLLNNLDRTTETAPLFRRKLLFLSLVSVIALVDSAGDVMYFTSFEGKADVTCCTLFFDLPERTTAMLTKSVLGEEYARYLLPLYYMTNIFFIAFMVISYIRFLPGRFISPPVNLQVLSLLGAGVVLSLLNAVISLFALFEIIAPKIMELPYHHCIYCMWQYAPDSIVLTALSVLGTFSVNWAFLLYITGRHKETVPHMIKYVRNLYFMGITALAASLAMVTIHFIAKG